MTKYHRMRWGYRAPLARKVLRALQVPPDRKAPPGPEACKVTSVLEDRKAKSVPQARKVSEASSALKDLRVQWDRLGQWA